MTTTMTTTTTLQGAAVAEAEVQSWLKAVQPEGDSLPRVLYVQLASAVQHRDYTAALDCLHRYFDYTAGLSRGHNGKVDAEGSAADGQRGRYANALLSLSATHAALGHTQQALSALGESLAMAQQAGDMACSLAALATLGRVLSAYTPDPSQTSLASIQQGAHHVHLLKLLRRCLTLAVEQVSPHLATFAALALAKFHLQHSFDTGCGASAGGSAGSGGDGGSAPAAAAGLSAAAAPLRVQQTLRDAHALAHACALSAAAPGGGSAILAHRASSATSQLSASTRAQQGGIGDLYEEPAIYGPATAAAGLPSRPSAATVHQLAGTAHLLASASWRQYGSAALSHAHAMAHLMCFGADASCQDLAVCLAQLVQSIAERQGPQAGQRALDVATRVLPVHAHKALAAVQLALHHDAAMSAGDAYAAEAAARELHATADLSPCLDLDIR